MAKLREYENQDSAQSAQRLNLSNVSIFIKKYELVTELILKETSFKYCKFWFKVERNSLLQRHISFNNNIFDEICEELLSVSFLFCGLLFLCRTFFGECDKNCFFDYVSCSAQSVQTRPRSKRATLSLKNLSKIWKIKRKESFRRILLNVNGFERQNWRLKEDRRGQKQNKKKNQPNQKL